MADAGPDGSASLHRLRIYASLNHRAALRGLRAKRLAVACLEELFPATNASRKKHDTRVELTSIIRLAMWHRPIIFKERIH